MHSTRFTSITDESISGITIHVSMEISWECQVPLYFCGNAKKHGSDLVGIRKNETLHFPFAVHSMWMDTAIRCWLFRPYWFSKKKCFNNNTIPQSWPRVTFSRTDPTRPGVPMTRPDPTRDTGKNLDPTRPDSRHLSLSLCVRSLASIGL